MEVLVFLDPSPEGTLELGGNGSWREVAGRGSATPDGSLHSGGPLALGAAGALGRNGVQGSLDPEGPAPSHGNRLVREDIRG